MPSNTLESVFTSRGVPIQMISLFGFLVVFAFFFFSVYVKVKLV